MLYLSVLIVLLAMIVLIMPRLCKRKCVLWLTVASMLLFTLAGCEKPMEEPANSTLSQTVSTEPTGSTAPTASTPTEPAPTEPAPTEPAPKEVGVTYNLIPGKPYKFGMVQETNHPDMVYYLQGTVQDPYLNTTWFAELAPDFYVERAGAGYYLYMLKGNTKYYLNTGKRGDNWVCNYETTASTVYLFKYGTLVSVIDGEEYVFGVRAKTTYSTVGLCKAYEDNYVCRFYGEITPGETDWLLGNWESVTRTEYEMEGFNIAGLSTWGFVFNPDGSGISGGYEWTSWDVETGGPAKEWTVPGMGFPSEYFSYALEGDILYITWLGADVYEMEPYLDVYKVTREDGGFITLTPVAEDRGSFRLINTEYAKNLEELCKAFGVDYSLPKN
ncbi:MAG: hypothetical protein J6Q30_04850 [Oscillospiraceae bacterium]|nr:hypothetical protein [Oscillospiraceae bacterium]